MLNVVQVREKKVDGRRFRFAEVKDTPADHASWWSFDDEQEVRDRHWHPKPGDVVLDIGAAFGSYTLPALALGARVVAFSPADFDTELLQKNLELNPDMARRCLVVRDGLYSRSGWFDPDHSVFTEDRSPNGTLAPELYGMIGNREDGGDGFPKGQLIRTTSLDAFLAEHPGIDRVDWIKMDVEGAEVEVLRGGEGCLRRWKPRVLVECHNFHDPRMELKVSDFMIGLGIGYRCDGPYQHCAVSHEFFEVVR